VFRTGFNKVKAYRKCNKLYEYSVLRNLQPKRRGAALLRGTILHEMLEAYDLHGRPAAFRVWTKYDTQYAQLFEEEREFYGENFMEDIWRIYRGYLRTWREGLWEVLKTEGLVRTQLTPKIEFEGHYDLLVRFNRRLWLVDRKSHKVIPNAEERFNNFQLLLYAEAWNREHEPKEQVGGIIWDYLRTKAPTIPEVLKGGALTRRKDLDTDVYTYRKAIRDNELDEDAYSVYLRELKQRSADRFYQRVPLPIPSKEMTNIVVDEFTQTAEMMRTAKHFPRNATYQCNRCDFFKLCNAELSGINAKYVEKNDYEQRPPDERENEMEIA
jgi:predicted RecB family nuclease